MFLTMV